VTGADLIEQLRAEAARRRTTVYSLATRLSPHPGKWLAQLGIATRPRPTTIARIEALIAGDDVPPPPNNFQAKPHRARPPHVAAAASDDEDLPPAVFRDPCPRCGVRADIGCPHSHVRLSMGAFA
jgi:hypothetical protein